MQLTKMWDIPVAEEGNTSMREELQITLTAGTPLFIVGPNGSGKSALLQDARMKLGGKRVSANRQVWLDSGRITTTPSARVQYGTRLKQEERNASYRWREFSPGNRWSAVLFDLVEAENALGRQIAEKAYAQEGVDVEGIAAIVRKKSMIFTRVNDLLKASGIPIAVQTSGGQVFAINKGSDTRYDIAQMSDGERSALLIAAEVLTASNGEVLLIDEPERHLNRGITVQFLSALFAERPDCIFVVSTHETDLPLANPDAQTIVVRSCNWPESSDASNAPYSWDAILLKKEGGLPESTKREILGSRKRILFVEGKADLPLYAALFPDISVTVRSAGGRKGVVSAVDGLRKSEGLHDVKAFGLVDGDGRNDAANLAQRGIYALPCYSVESLYYCDDAISAVARRVASDHDDRLDADKMFAEAKKAAIDALKKETCAETMVSQICERQIREEILGQIPRVEDIKNNHRTKSVIITVESNYADERQRYDQLVSESNLEELVTRYPLKKSPVYGLIAKNLRFASKELYESRVVNVVRNDPCLADALRGRIKQLANALGDE